MKVGLFIPCYVDQIYPEIGMDVVRIFQKLKIDFDYPLEQTCCGQPMLNSGFSKEAEKIADQFVDIFHKYDYIVSPSGSCTSLVKNHYSHIVQHKEYPKVQQRIYEFTEFLVDVLKFVPQGKFAKKVALHHSCHGLRELRIGSGSERNVPSFSKLKSLLSNLEGIEFLDFDRTDECCGFGGTFSVIEDSVSSFMGMDKMNSILKVNPDVIVGYDVSCIMHLENICKKQNISVQFMHIASVIHEVMK